MALAQAKSRHHLTIEGRDGVLDRSAIISRQVAPSSAGENRLFCTSSAATRIALERRCSRRHAFVEPGLPVPPADLIDARMPSVAGSLSAFLDVGALTANHSRDRPARSSGVGAAQPGPFAAASALTSALRASAAAKPRDPAVARAVRRRGRYSRADQPAPWRVGARPQPMDC